MKYIQVSILLYNIYSYLPIVLVFNASNFTTEKGIVIGNSSSLGWSPFLGWFLIAGACFSVLSIIVILICIPIRSNKLDITYENLTW